MDGRQRGGDNPCLPPTPMPLVSSSHGGNLIASSLCLPVLFLQCVCVCLRENNKPPLNPLYLPSTPTPGQALSAQGPSSLGKSSLGELVSCLPSHSSLEPSLLRDQVAPYPPPSSASRPVCPDSPPATSNCQMTGLPFPQTNPSVPHLLHSARAGGCHQCSMADFRQTWIWRFWPLGLRQARR